MYFRTVVLILLLTSVSAKGQVAATNTSPDRAYDTVLVCPPDLLPAAAGWLDHRSRQGHKIAVVSGAGSKAEIKTAIQSLHSDSKLKTVVIFGDAPRGAGKKLGTQVETHKRESAVIRKWGAEPTFATDSYYADLDDDGVPDVAIGRITADTPGELSSITNKIIAYEKNPDVGMWRRRVNFIAGVGGFGVLADKVLESAAKKFITDGIPSEFQTSMTQASWRSPYSPHPGMFRAQTIERMNEGCLAWIYLGHGRKRELDYYRVPQGGLPIMSARDVEHVNVRQGAPIAVFLSCYTGAFDSDPDCMAEELLANPAGPVAVIAGANVTMPYAMTVLGNEMLRQMFDQRRETLGEVLLYGQRKLVEKTEAGRLGLIDQLARVISPDPDLLDEERQEHSRLFHLIGDPLLKLRHPGRVTVEATEYATSGQQLEVAGHAPFNGDCRVEFVCRRDRMTFKPQSRPKFQLEKAWLDGLQETYAKANNTVWDAKRVPIRNGKFTTKLSIPADARGPAHVRVYVEGGDDFAMGATDVYVRPPPAELVPESIESPDPQPAAVSPIN